MHSFLLIFEIIPAAYVPLFIFFARILDVSIGTLRIMFVSKGLRARATMLGFIEVFIWIIIVAQIFQNLDNWLNYIAYAGGFATGTYIGMFIEEKMKVGVQIFRIIVNQNSDKLVDRLKEADFRVTSVNGDGKFGPVKVLFTIAQRKRWKELSKIINDTSPNAFYSVEDVRQVSQMDDEKHAHKLDTFSRLLKIRKGI